MKTYEEYVIKKVQKLEDENEQLKDFTLDCLQILELIHKHGRIDDDGLFTAIPLCLTDVDKKDNQILCDWFKSWGKENDGNFNN